MAPPPPPTTPLVELLGRTNWLRSLAGELVRDAAAADDLAQATAARALERPPRRSQNLRGWLARVMRNLARERARRELVRGALEPRAARAERMEPALELVERAETQRRLVEAVLALDEPYRTTVLLRYFEELPPRRIARQQGVPLATVTSRLARALATLRARLGAGPAGSASSVDRRRDWLDALVLLSAPPVGSGGAGLAPALLGGAGRLGDLLAMGIKSKLALAGAALAALAVGTRLALAPSPSSALAPAGPSAVLPGASDADAPVAVDRAAALPVEPRAIARAEPGPPSIAPGDAFAAAWPDDGAVVTGMVLSPDGRPVDWAQVVGGDEDALAAAENGVAPERLRTARTDADGRFRLRGLGPAWTHVTARADKAAYSASALVDLRGGGSAAGVVLVLRRGARLTGQVLGRDGAPRLGGRVSLEHASSGLRLERTTYDDGRFLASHLAPGRWRLSTQLGRYAREVPDLGIHEDPVSVELDLFDGEERAVVLGGPLPRPVTVRGAVRRGSEVLGGTLAWVPRGGGTVRTAIVGDRGRYAVVLDQPGPYLVAVDALPVSNVEAWMQHTGGGAEFDVEVPDQAALERDFDLPAASLFGRCVWADGSPAAGVKLTLRLNDGRAPRSAASARPDQGLSNDDGSFRFEFLEPGDYSVVAASARPDGIRAGLATTAPMELRAGQELGPIEIRLVSGATVWGTAKDRLGMPVNDARVFVYGEDGSLLVPISSTASDVAGAFLLPGLAPGTYWLVARTAELVSFPTELDVTRSGASPVELVLAPGAFLSVAIEPSGAAEGPARTPRPFVDVRDEGGRSFAGLRSRFAPREPWPEGWDAASATERFGPLPPGTYSVRAGNSGDRRHDARVTLRGGEHRRVALAPD